MYIYIYNIYYILYNIIHSIYNIYVTIHTLKFVESSTRSVNPNVSYGL